MELGASQSSDGLASRKEALCFDSQPANDCPLHDPPVFVVLGNAAWTCYGHHLHLRHNRQPESCVGLGFDSWSRQIQVGVVNRTHKVMVHHDAACAITSMASQAETGALQGRAGKGLDPFNTLPAGQCADLRRCLN